jgi:predicted nucleotidyltransferase
MKASAHDSPAASLPESVSSEDQQYIWTAARFLKEQGAKKVWLFGSLAKGRRPTVHSDFDFAVEGLPGDRLFGSVGHLLQVLPRHSYLRAQFYVRGDLRCCRVERLLRRRELIERWFSPRRSGS